MAFSGSFLTLLAFYMVYLLLGGYIFYNIECAEEMAVKRRVVALERESMMLIVEGLELLDLLDLLDLELIRHVERLEHLQDEEASPDMAPFITQHIKQIIENRTYEEAKEKYKVCETWGFFNSFFFGFTTVTTIGYGKISPQTQLGRVACLIYSIIGIPLNTVVIGFIGNFLMNKGSG